MLSATLNICKFWTWIFCTIKLLPVHRAGLVSTVGNVVEEVAHAWVLCTLLSSAEVVVHHLVYNIVRDTTTAV